MNHQLLPSLVGRKLAVHVVGCGGNGSQFLSGLARMALSLHALGHPGLTVTVFDPDTVSEANLGRQLFSPGDLGQNKATVLVHRLNCFFGLDWTANTSRYASAQADLLVGCVDTIASRRTLNQSRFTYWLDLGNTDHTGQVVLGVKAWAVQGSAAAEATRPRTFFELFPHLRRQKREDDAPSCSLAGALERQDLFINQAVTTWGLQLVWSLLRHGHVSANGYYLNLKSGVTRPIPLVTPAGRTRKAKAKPIRKRK